MEAPEKLKIPKDVGPQEFFRNDPRFVRALKRVTGVSLMDPWRLYTLWQFAQKMIRSPSLGNALFAEVGVYLGGSALVVSEAIETAPHKDFRFHLFDTFEGLPKPDPARDPYHKEGDFKEATLERVEEFLAEYKILETHKGLFPKTAKGLEDKLWAFVHVDVDLYQPSKDCLNFFCPKLSPNGILVLDDYGFQACAGVKQAVDEYLAGNRAFSGIYLPTGQMLVVRS